MKVIYYGLSSAHLLEHYTDHLIKYLFRPGESIPGIKDEDREKILNAFKRLGTNITKASNALANRGKKIIYLRMPSSPLMAFTMPL